MTRPRFFVPAPLTASSSCRELLLGDVEPELLDLDPDRVEPALLAEHDAPLRPDELGGVGLDRGRVVELRGDRARLAREEVVAR